MKTADYLQNLAILLFVLAMTFGVWHFGEIWHGAWSVLIFLSWISSDTPNKYKKSDLETETD